MSHKTKIENRHKFELLENDAEEVTVFLAETDRLRIVVEEVGVMTVQPDEGKMEIVIENGRSVFYA